MVELYLHSQICLHGVVLKHGTLPLPLLSGEAQLLPRTFPQFDCNALQYSKLKNSLAFSPQANYTDRATAAFRRS
jgi:hypothetical protein